MKKKLTIRHWDKPDRTIEVEYRERKHYLADAYPGAANVNGNPWKAYDVYVDGERIGYVEQTTQSTDRSIRGTRLRTVGRGRLAWGWTRPRTRKDNPGIGPISNTPGLPARTRDDAVAELLGYSEARR